VDSAALKESLTKDYVEANMWFAIVSSGVVPPADDHHMKWAARHMTEAQIAKAQRTAEDRTRHH